MRHAIEERTPLTRQEVLIYLNDEVEKNAKQWGEDYIYTRWARESRDKMLKKFDAGEVIPVYTASYVDSYGNGCGDYSDTLYSDGTVKTACYGYLD